MDSSTYPDGLGDNKESESTVVTGFNGIIRILETYLSLTSPIASENIPVKWQ